MSNFITALVKQRKDAKKAVNTTGRLKEIIGIVNKYNYDDGITPEIVVSILQDLGPTFVKIGQLASQMWMRESSSCNSSPMALPALWDAGSMVAAGCPRRS